MNKKNSNQGFSKLLTLHPNEYFHSLVQESTTAMEVQVSEESQFYLGRLLSNFIHSENLFPKDKDGNPQEEALAIRFAKACEEKEGSVRSEQFRRLGDFALYIVGYFTESLEKKLVDVNYYMDMGGASYSEVAKLNPVRAEGSLFQELSDKFPSFVSILWKVGEEIMLHENEKKSILKIFELWEKTGNKKFAEQLKEKGVDIPEETKDFFSKKM